MRKKMGKGVMPWFLNNINENIMKRDLSVLYTLMKPLRIHK